MNVLILMLGMLAAFGPLSIDMYLPALPTIALDFKAPLSQVQFSLASFFIGLAVGQIFYGPVTDRFGRKKPLYFGISLYGLASLGCALSTSVEMLIICRMLQALGSCSGMVISRAIVRDQYHARESARVFSLLMLIMGVAPILAPTMGGYIAIHFGWRMIFWFLVSLSVATLLCLFFFLPETLKEKKKNSKREILSIYFQIFRTRSFIGNTMAGACAQAGMLVYITSSPWVFMEHFGLSSERYAWVFGANAFGLIFCSQLNARLLRRHTPEQVLKTIYPLLATVSLGLFLAGLLDARLEIVVGLLFVFLSLLGMTFPNSTASALAAQSSYAGSASALMGTLQFTTSACLSFLVSSFHNETMLPMTFTIGGCGVLALGIFYWVVVGEGRNSART